MADTDAIASLVAYKQLTENFENIIFACLFQVHPAHIMKPTRWWHTHETEVSYCTTSHQISHSFLLSTMILLKT